MFGRKSKPQRIELRVQNKAEKGGGGVVVSNDMPGMVLVCTRPERLDAMLAHFVTTKVNPDSEVEMKSVKMNWKKGVGEAIYVVK